jgi:hypothetical protein
MPRARPRQPTVLLLAAAAIASACTTLPAAAQYSYGTANDRFAFIFAGGYSHPDADRTPGIDYSDGFYFDFETDWRLDPDQPLWLGLGFNTAYYDGDQRFVGIDTAQFDADLYTFSIEARLSYVVAPAPGDIGPFLSARLGAGLLLADSEHAEAFPTNGVGSFVFVTDYDTSAGFQLRPSLLVGYDGGPWQVGAELAYSFAWMDSDELGHDFQQFQAGLFVRLTY